MRTKDKQPFDVIIVGGGHAGIEAAYAAAKLGARTALVTLDNSKIGLMPCNPSIGGVGKGHIVFEVSALGGLMPQLCTKTYLQARMLNTRKGQAVQGLRLQIDKHAYAMQARRAMEQTNNLTIIQDKVQTVLRNQTTGDVSGILLASGQTVSAKQVVLTTGTFLKGTVHIGANQTQAGRMGEQAVTSLSEFLRSTGLVMGRLKTGTPPRLLHESIDFSKLEHQETDELFHLFEFAPHTVVQKRSCHITHTNETTHDIVRKHLHLTAQGLGNLEGKAPRYCPSIEDKITRFADKSAHHVFVEPEDARGHEIYPSGLSTSLPHELQQQFIRSIKGFEQAVITKPGYAVEYDFVHPNQLRHTLEVKMIPGLFLAGQINGTTGYEEAAGQGIVAGINAALRSQNREAFILERTNSYIGVMIDDLVTLGVDEPYRMFTSRAERRLALRQDNAFARLMPQAHKLGLISDELFQQFSAEQTAITTAVAYCNSKKQSPVVRQLFSQPSCNRVAVAAFLAQHCAIQLSDRALQTVHADIRYAPYLEREKRELQRMKEYQALRIPESFDFTTIPGLSKELQEKLTRYKPSTLAAAELIPGITPAALSLLRITLTTGYRTAVHIAKEH